ncbi:hypothetical protein TWF718_003475 [Orbilia javanica]|uniref:F-box domain-containing protein n=1 Tax=Orbilia javanica TaxID=47235 RepID=A0AAN8MEP6_9PEZI
MSPFTLDHLPSEIILQCCKYLDDYTILSTLRPVCRSWCYATDIKIPAGTMAGLPPAIWEKILGYNMDYKTIHAVSQTCSSLRSLTKSSRMSRLQGSAYRLPAPAAPVYPAITTKMVQHPAFESICCRIETGSLIYHRSGNCCPNDILAFPVAEENATNPPVSKILVKFSSKYGVSLRPVLIDRPRRENEGGVTVGDVYKAMQRLFAEPLSQKQIVAIKQIRDWEARKHEAAKQSLARMEKLNSTSAGTAAEPSSPTPKAVPEKEPIIEHDDAIIYLDYPFEADSLPHSHNTVRRQREFLNDFPYVYASVHVGGVINSTQVFNLTYH